MVTRFLGRQIDRGCPAVSTPAAVVCSFGLFLITFAFVRGPLFFWDETSLHLLPAGSYTTITGGLFISAGVLLNRRLTLELFTSPLGYGLALVTYMLSDAPNRIYSLFQGPAIRGEILLVSLLIPFLLQFNLRQVLKSYLFLSVVVCIVSFITESGGRVIFNDDHPAVFYRLSLLKAMFPEFPFYNPQWNAGVEARDFLSTGILNFFLIYYPIIKLFDLERTYNYLVIVTNIIGLPVSAYFGSRLLRMRPESAIISSILALGTSLSWYRWLLKYGTMGFATSAILSIFIFCFLGRICLDRRFHPGWPLLTLAIFTTCLMLFWTPIWFLFLPIAIFILFGLKQLLVKRWFCVFAITVAVFTLPWVIVWLKVSKVHSFVTTPSSDQESIKQTAEITTSENQPEESLTPTNTGTKDKRKYGGKSRKIKIKGVFKELRNFAVGVNPLIIVLSLPAILSLSRRKLRWLFGLTTLWLLLLGSVLSFVKPQLELERLLVVSALLLTVPIGGYIFKLFTLYRSHRFGSLGKIATLPTLACLLLTPVTTVGVVRNRTLENFVFKPTAYNELTNLIGTYGGSGRVLFSGFVLHELGGGHLASLALSVSNPLVATSHVHDHWSYHGSIPEAYLEEKERGIEQYLDYLNVTAVLAHEKGWRKYFEKHPEIYTYRGDGGRFKFYSRKVPDSSYILHGSGSIDAQDFNALLVTPQSSELVIKFRFIDKLKATGCKLQPFELPGDLQLIQLHECEPGKQIRISRERELW